MNKTRIALLMVILGRTFPKTKTSDFTPDEVFSSQVTALIRLLMICVYCLLRQKQENLG